MKKLKYLTFLISVLIPVFFITGCQTIETTRMQMYLNPENLPEKTPDQVIVYQKKPSSKDFREIGEVRVEDAEAWNSVEKIFKEKAAMVGADAVYVHRINYINKDVYVPRYLDEFAYRDTTGFHYHYGHRQFGYMYSYPDGFITASETVVTATGILISFTKKQEK